MFVWGKFNHVLYCVYRKNVVTSCEQVWIDTLTLSVTFLYNSSIYSMHHIIYVLVMEQTYNIKIILLKYNKKCIFSKFNVTSS